MLLLELASGQRPFVTIPDDQLELHVEAGPRSQLERLECISYRYVRLIKDLCAREHTSRPSAAEAYSRIVEDDIILEAADVIVNSLPSASVADVAVNGPPSASRAYVTVNGPS